MGEFARRDQLIGDARESAGSDVRLQEAVASVAADLLLEQGQAQRALEALEPLQDGGTRHLGTLHLLLRVEKALDHHERVYTLARTLMRRHFLDKAEALALIDHAGAARLRAGMDSGDGWRMIWKEMKAEERQLPGISLAAAAAYEASGDGAEAGRILENAINVDFNPTLVAAYSRCDAEQVPRRLATAETWLQQRPDDANLLTALGMLCLNGMLWGQAERYLQRSLARRDDPQCHALLGILYDRLNRPEDAARHWRQASAYVAALPVLAADAALPPADTDADPHRLDAEGEYSAWSPPGPAAASSAPAGPAEAAEPSAPPAVDYVIDADEDYYDSDPIKPNPLTDHKG
jgi:HemY protein